MTRIAQNSLGTGDRFAHQAAAQLKAVTDAAEQGIQLDIVWNKSYREHKIIGSSPAKTREAADAALASYRKLHSESSWQGSAFLDADHIGKETVKGFLPYCEFYTLDVADYIGNSSPPEYLDRFTKAAAEWSGRNIEISGMEDGIFISDEMVKKVGSQFLDAVRKAGELYRHIASQREGKECIIEVSMDETSSAQSPEEIFLILLALSLEDIPLQTFAPRFSGRFNKGVQYVGDPRAFEKEFEADALILRHGAKVLGLPGNLKLSLHSGSDKFAIYPGINRVLKRHKLGLHVKTAGTTWLEELIGLCESGEEGASLVRKVYKTCIARLEELTKPYAEVIDIDPLALPKPETLNELSPGALAEMIRHDNENSAYNPSMRQLFHVGYKVAAELGDEYLGMLEKHEKVIGRHVTENLLKRHILKIWG